MSGICAYLNSLLLAAPRLSGTPESARDTVDWLTFAPLATIPCVKPFLSIKARSRSDEDCTKWILMHNTHNRHAPINRCVAPALLLDKIRR